MPSQVTAGSQVGFIGLAARHWEPVFPGWCEQAPEEQVSVVQAFGSSVQEVPFDVQLQVLSPLHVPLQPSVPAQL